MIFYKFTSSERAKEILQSGKIRFAQLSSLNDPFESILPIDGYITQDLAMQLFDTIMSDNNLLNSIVVESINRTYEKLSPIQKSFFDKDNLVPSMQQFIKDELKKNGTNLKEFLLNLINTNIESVLTNMKKNVNTYIADIVCVLSLSTAKTSLLMWSYYSDSHRGVAIGFDSNNPYFSNAISVRYQSEKPIPDFHSLPTTDKEKEFIAKEMLAVKNIAWHHEEEYRLIRPSVVMELLDKSDSRGFQVYVSSFPKESVVEVILGSKCSELDQYDFHNILFSNYADIKVYKSYLDTSGYKISFSLAG